MPFISSGFFLHFFGNVPTVPDNDGMTSAAPRRFLYRKEETPEMFCNYSDRKMPRKKCPWVLKIEDCKKKREYVTR